MGANNSREKLNAIASERILILDGAMGSMIQKLHLTEADFRSRRFVGYTAPLLGCNDVLCLTKPELINSIHEAYLDAGADIIETCSFCSTSVSLSEYGLGPLSREINTAAAQIARKAADKYSTADKPRFVAGSIGPTGKSASLSPDVSNPGLRGINRDELEASYYEAIRGLLDGGVDILLAETMFDTLNIKAALSAISRLFDERNIAVPVIISATISGDSGRLLSGQTIDAFFVSVYHASPWAVGLNCSFGAEKMISHARSLCAAAKNYTACGEPPLISAYPNAGLPNQFGGYDESPETMAACMEDYMREGLVNIIGGCCGTTPAHIRAIAGKAALYKPRPQTKVPGEKPVLNLAGLEVLSSAGSRLTVIGEQTNVSGSRNFLRLISGEKFREALAFARAGIAEGVQILNIGMDDAMLDSEKSMCTFLGLALSDPDIAAKPFMIDSSRWNVIEAGLKLLQGKGLVNSINLKDGETEFLRRAGIIRRFGAAAVVMLIDENGQAVSYERKIEIAGRAYRLLAGSGFPPEDIVFDPNVLAVATGIAEHDSCALDFIRACKWIRSNCPGVQISGGISNLSYSFRGNNTVRQAMHSVFLYHAEKAGLSMAIVNPSALIAYNAIEENLRNAAEDVILNRRPGAAGRLLALAEKTTGSVVQTAAHHTSSDWRNLDTQARIVHAMIHGIDDYIEADALELAAGGTSDGKIAALAVVEGPLMDGMREVGKRFDEGSMYLPQVLRSAQVMKKAAAALEPFTTASRPAEKTNAAGDRQKIILATVKGDVHDIGKNIVSVVLACNGYKVIDLGVMVPAEKILEAAENEQADAIGLSGLISPSLDEMAIIAREMEKRKMHIPLLIGGAAASLIYTSLRLAPEYSGPVVYAANAGKAAQTVRALLTPSLQPGFLKDLKETCCEAVRRHDEINSHRETLTPEEARINRVPAAAYLPAAPKVSGIIDLCNYPPDRITPFIDWPAFLQRWESAPAGDVSCEQLLNDAKALLERVKAEDLLQLRGVAGIFPAASDGDIIITGEGSLQRRFHFPRNRQKKPSGRYNPCLADFILPLHNGQTADWLGLFALGCFSAGEHTLHQDDYHSLLLASLANALTEAFAEEIHSRVRREWWGYAADEQISAGEILSGKYTGIRPAFGYPACPAHEDKRIAFELLEAEKRCGFGLTETSMIIPASSVCGMFFASPAAYYFNAGSAGDVT